VAKFQTAGDRNDNRHEGGGSMKRYLLGVFLALLLVSIPLGANSEGESVSAQITDTEGNTFNVKEVEFGLSRDDTSAQWGKAVVRIKVKDIKKLDRIERPPKTSMHILIYS